MSADRYRRALPPIWCPRCEKVTEHSSIFIDPKVVGDAPLVAAEPPAGTRHAVTCGECRMIHAWWARPRE